MDPNDDVVLLRAGTIMLLPTDPGSEYPRRLPCASELPGCIIIVTEGPSVPGATLVPSSTGAGPEGAEWLPVAAAQGRLSPGEADAIADLLLAA